MTLINHHCFESTPKITLPPPPPEKEKKETSLGWIGSCEGFYLILKGMAFGGS